MYDLSVHMCFPVNFVNTFFTEHLWATASILTISIWRKTKLNLLFYKKLSKTQLSNKIDSNNLGTRILVLVKFEHITACSEQGDRK